MLAARATEKTQSTAALMTTPLALRAQPADRVRRIGVLMLLAAEDSVAQTRIGAFQQALREFGWIDGQNLRIDYRWSVGNADQVRIVELHPGRDVAVVVEDLDARLPEFLVEGIGLAIQRFFPAAQSNLHEGPLRKSALSDLVRLGGIIGIDSGRSWHPWRIVGRFSNGWDCRFGWGHGTRIGKIWTGHGEHRCARPAKVGPSQANRSEVAKEKAPPPNRNRGRGFRNYVTD